MPIRCVGFLLFSVFLVGADQIGEGCEDEIDDSSIFLQVQSVPFDGGLLDQHDDDVRDIGNNGFQDSKTITASDDSMNARSAQHPRNRPQAPELVQQDARNIRNQHYQGEAVAHETSILDSQFGENQRQDQIVSSQRSQVAGRVMENGYGQSGHELASSTQNTEDASSLEAAKMLLTKERERVRDLEEYAMLADSKNRKLAELDNRLVEEIKQHRSSNARLRVELANLRKRCRNDIEEVLADSGTEVALLQTGSILPCISFNSNGSVPVVDKGTCDNACLAAASIPCLDSGCMYTGQGARHPNTSMCQCPKYKRVFGAKKLYSVTNLCSDLGYFPDSAFGHSLSLAVLIGILFTFTSRDISLDPSQSVGYSRDA